MKRWRWILVGAAAFLATFALSPRAQAQPFATAELEGLLAPVALHPDAVLWSVLDASTEPQDVAAAARWSRGNPGLSGGVAVAAVEPFPWHPAVKTLVAYPDLLARMAEDPQWTFDLGNAYLAQRDEVLATVQALRQRAYAGGHLRSDGGQVVQHYGSVIAVAPAVPHYYLVRYYDPVVVFGPAWRPARHYHVHPRPVHKDVYVHPRPVYEHKRIERHRNGPPSPAIRMQREQAAQYRHHHRVPESRRQPIVQSRPQAPRFEHRGGTSHGGHSRANGFQSRGHGGLR